MDNLKAKRINKINRTLPDAFVNALREAKLEALDLAEKRLCDQEAAAAIEIEENTSEVTKLLRDVDPAVQKEFVRRWLIENKDDESVVVNGGYNNYWYHFSRGRGLQHQSVASKSAEEVRSLRWANWKRLNPSAKMKKFYESVYGTLDNAMEITLLQFRNWDEKAISNKVKDVLKIDGPFETLTGEATVSVREMGGMNNYRLQEVGSFLRQYNGGKQVLAGKDSVRAVENKYATPLQVGVYKYDVPSKTGDPEDVETVELVYTYGDAVEALIQHLKELRDGPLKLHDIGIDLVDDGFVLLQVINGDHGGDSTKFPMSYLCYEGADQKHYTNLGEFPDKESYDLMANCCIPQINEGIGKLNNMYGLIVEWNAGFDFQLVMRECCHAAEESVAKADRFGWPAEVSYKRVGNKFLLKLRGDDIDNDEEGICLDREDIPLDDNELSFKCLPISTHNNGDLKHVFCCEGRPGHEGSKCPMCALKASDWSDGHKRGILFTAESMEQEIADYILGNSIPPNDETAAEKDRREAAKLRSDLQVAQSGIKSSKRLWTNIPKSNHRFATLHSRLGLINKANSNLFDMVATEVEEELLIVTQCRIRAETAKHTLDDTKDMKVAYIAANCAQYKESKDGCKTLERLKTNVGYTVLVDRKQRHANENGPPLTEKMAADLVAKQLVIDSLATLYGAGSPHKAAVDAMIATYEEDLRTFDKAITECEKAYNVVAKELGKLKSDVRYKPVKKGIEKILEEFNVVAQQSYSMQLIGAACQQMTRHHEEICERVLELLLTAIDNQEAAKGMPRDEPRREKVRTFMCQLEEIYATLDIVCCYMTQMPKLKPEEITEYRASAEYLGEIWRHYFQTNGPPKLHLLEVHSVDDMMRFHRLGIFGEDPVERLHHIKLIYNRQYATIRRWDIRQKYIKARIDQANMPAVQQIISAVKDNKVKPDTKRKTEIRESAYEATKEARHNSTIRKRMEKLGEVVAPVVVVADNHADA
jgi:hypothetical protein